MAAGAQATSRQSPLAAGPAPQLEFRIEGAGALEYAAVPTIRFELGIESPGVAVRSLLLNIQVQIAARRRAYDDRAQERLVELFGTPERWGSTLRTLPWLRTTVVVPPFEDATVAEVPVALSYDLEVAASRYFYALEDGLVPLEFLFSGSVFYLNRQGQLQTTRITWESEAEYELPVALWRETMDRHFPGVAWIRLERESFDRLYAFKAKHALPSWEAAIERLIPAAGDDEA